MLLALSGDPALWFNAEGERTRTLDACTRSQGVFDRQANPVAVRVADALPDYHRRERREKARAAWPKSGQSAPRNGGGHRPTAAAYFLGAKISATRTSSADRGTGGFVSVASGSRAARAGLKARGTRVVG